MNKHITLVGAINIGFGLLGLLIATIIFTVLVGAGILSEDPQAMAITSTIGTVIAFFITVRSLPEIIGGIGLMKRKNWARIVILVISCLDLIEIPIGTAIGAYSIWVLLNDETIQLMEHNDSKPKK